MNNFYLEKFKLKKDIVYVVGGYGTIGKEVTKALCQKDSTVIILDIKKDFTFLKYLKKKKNNVFFKKFDVSKINKIDSELISLFKKYGCPNILVNCTYPTDNRWIKNTFSKIKISSLKKNLVINLASCAWISKTVAEQMKKKKLKNMSIINMSSIYGLVAQDLSLYENTNLSENLTYSIIKGGIINYTKQMASYYGKYNIRVNSIAPGGLEGKISGKQQKQDSLFKKNYMKKNPIKRFCKAEDVASATLFLASESSSYITGTTLVVDGGYTII